MQGQVHTPDGQRYELLGELGRGGFGTVYKARAHGEGGFYKTVALKVLNAEIAEEPGFAERLRDEARVLGMLQHRAIVRVHDLIRLDGSWTIVMELVTGVDIKHLVGAGPMPPGPALEVVEEVASALDTVFSAPGPDGAPVHLIHRDIKPSNIRLTPAGEVKVLDFGVARAEFQHRESQTRSLFFGSIGYMAPERIDGIDTHRGDVYSLGSVLVEMISGEPVGRTSAHPERHEGVRTAALGRLWARCPDRELYELAARCLAYDPDARPDARELARTVRHLRSRHREPWLRDWAESTVPALLTAARRAPSPSSSSRSRPPAAPSAAPEPAPSGSLARPSSASHGRLVLGISMAVGFLAVAGVGGGIAAVLAQTDTSPAPPVVQVAPPPPAPAAGLDLLAEDEPEPEALPEPEPEPERRSPRRAAAPPPPTDRSAAPPPEAPPPPAPAPRAVPTGRVQLAGDATKVQLVGASTHGPGSVPAGTYRILATFPNSSTPVSAGTVTVKAGGVVTLSCRAGLGRCTVR
jgi:serine/threonine-protein kinase